MSGSAVSPKPSDVPRSPPWRFSFSVSAGVGPAGEPRSGRRAEPWRAQPRARPAARRIRSGCHGKRPGVRARAAERSGWCACRQRAAVLGAPGAHPGLVSDGRRPRSALALFLSISTQPFSMERVNAGRHERTSSTAMCIAELERWRSRSAFSSARLESGMGAARSARRGDDGRFARPPPSEGARRPGRQWPERRTARAHVVRCGAGATSSRVTTPRARAPGAASGP